MQLHNRRAKQREWDLPPLQLNAVTGTQKKEGNQNGFGKETRKEKANSKVFQKYREGDVC